MSAGVRPGVGAAPTRCAAGPSVDGAHVCLATGVWLTAHDVLHNKTVPKSLQASWLGALKQIVPESAALSVHAEYPSFRRLYAYMQRAERDHARRARGGGGGGAAVDLGALENVRVGAKRFGPARSRRLYRVIMATREQAAEPVQ